MIIYRSFSSFFAKEERFGSFKSLVLLVAFAILATSNTYAQASFETIDGLRYLIDSDAKTATLTANPNGEKYTGDIVVPGKVKASNGVEYTVTSFGESCFDECSGLTSITIPSSVTSLGKSCFERCSGLRSITIPSSVTSLGESCFFYCYGLTSITIPSSVTSLGESCFWHCDSLEQIVFPATLKILGQESCSYISELKRIYCMASEPPVCEESTLNPGNTPFGDYEPVHNLSTPNDIPVYVPVGTAEKYRKAWGWDYFTNFIETDDFPTTGVDNITISPQKEEQIYDLSGKKVTNMENGRIYIINGKKVISTTH